MIIINKGKCLLVIGNDMIVNVGILACGIPADNPFFPYEILTMKIILLLCYCMFFYTVIFRVTYITVYWILFCY